MKHILYSPDFGSYQKRVKDFVEILQSKGLRVGFVESSLGGFMSQALVKFPGASKIFVGSIIPYSYDMKESFNLPKSAVSEDYTNKSAEIFFNMLKADLVISESSILGPGGGSDQKPVGLSFVSIVSSRGRTSFVNLFRGSRLDIMKKVASFCFFVAKNHIIGWDLKERVVSSTFLCYKGKILIMKRSRKVGTYKGMWGVVSGHVEEGETPLETALKEIEEETSIKRDLIKNIFQGMHFEVVDRNIGIKWKINPFRAEIDGKPRLKIDWEHIQYKFIRPTDIFKFKTAPMLYQGYLKTLFNF